MPKLPLPVILMLSLGYPTTLSEWRRESMVDKLLNSIMLCTMSCLTCRPYSTPITSLYAVASLASAASLSALRALFSNKLFLLAAKIACCLSSTPCNQYPKLAPVPAKSGYAHSDSLLKNGRISRPSCHARTAMPRSVDVSSRRQSRFEAI